MHYLLVAFIILVAMPTGFGMSAFAGDDAQNQPSQFNCTKRGSWCVTESENFSVWTRSPGTSVDVAARCEKLRCDLHAAWGSAEIGPWLPKCAVVVHPSQAEYRRELAGDDEAVGCTTLTRDADRIVFRRIDLRADAANWQIDALAHELTHVVIAELVQAAELPRWLNEGLAMLSESDELFARRTAALAEAHRLGVMPSIRQIVDEGSNSDAVNSELDYAVSAAMVAHLDSMGTREQLLMFAQQAAVKGCDAALHAFYDMPGGVTEWERRWLAALTAEPTPLVIR